MDAAGIEASGDGRRAPWDMWRRLSFDGGPVGAANDAARIFMLGLAATAALTGVVVAENIISILHQAGNASVLEPFVREGSSWLSVVLFACIPWSAALYLRTAPSRWWRFVAVHSCGAFAFSFCHVMGFVTLRTWLYGLAGWPYGFGVFEFPYEFKKDAIGYAMIVAAFSVAASFVRRRPAEVVPDRQLFEIRDGARLTRVQLDDVVTIASAGNYAEFSLRDGRKLLTRKALSALEQELSSRGFIRTHRSWIVNSRAVTGLKPAGSGDFTVALGDAVVPLSRRFPQALDKLRGA